MWSLHDKVQSTVRPRNFVELHMGIVLLLWSIIISIWFVFLVVKFTNCVLEKFKENKLFLNHSFKLLNIVLISFLKLNKLECDIKMLVSSANKKRRQFFSHKHRQVIYKNEKKQGPKNGTPGDMYNFGPNAGYSISHLIIYKCSLISVF